MRDRQTDIHTYRQRQKERQRQRDREQDRLRCGTIHDQGRLGVDVIVVCFIINYVIVKH